MCCRWYCKQSSRDHDQAGDARITITSQGEANTYAPFVRFLPHLLVRLLAYIVSRPLLVPLRLPRSLSSLKTPIATRNIGRWQLLQALLEFLLKDLRAFQCHLHRPCPSVIGQPSTRGGASASSQRDPFRAPIAATSFPSASSQKGRTRKVPRATCRYLD